MIDMKWLEKRQTTFDLNIINRQSNCIKAQKIMHLYSDVNRYKLLLDNLNREKTHSKKQQLIILTK